MVVFSQNANDSIQPANINDSVLFAQSTANQEPKKIIQITKTGNVYSYMLNDEVLTLNKMAELIQYNSTATDYMKKAKGSSGFANILGYAGGFLIGYPLGTALGGGDANWTLVAVGCGLVAIAIPIVISANKNLLKAAETYNMGVTSTSHIEKYDIRLGLNQTDLVLAIRF